MNGLHIIGLFLILSLLGVPLAVSMGLSAVTYMVIAGIPLATIAHRMGNALNSFPLLAVVLFIFVGSLLNATGITYRLYEAAKLVVGRVKGGLAYVNVLANLVMAGISGAALADIGALGKAKEIFGLKLVIGVRRRHGGLIRPSGARARQQNPQGENRRLRENRGRL